MTLPLRVLLITLSLMIGAGAQAQNLFAPVASIDGRVVTAFELDQRARMLSLFRAPGDPREEAMRALVDERLQLIEGERAGITISDEELMTGMEEFAGRANLTVDEFLQSLSAQGIDATTYEDFVRAGIVWRRIVRDRFGSLGRNVTDDDVAARLRAPPRPGLRVLLSELIIPANNPEAAARAQALAPQIGAITSVAAFSAAAREYSAAPTREAGGQLEWLELENLPAPIRAAIQGLRPGQVSAPLALPNALAFFQLRATEESPAQAPVRSLDYAAFYFPAGPEGQATLGELTTRVQTCEDLYAFAQGLPPSRLQRDRLVPGEIPTDVALELAKLDEGEVSTALTRAQGQTRVWLMLCERTYRTQQELAEIDLAQVRDAIANERVARRATLLLSELRANANITYP